MNSTAIHCALNIEYMQHFCIKMSKNDKTFVIYFVELCT